MSWFSETFGLNIQDSVCPNIYQNGGIRISVITERLIRVEWQSEALFCDKPTQSILHRDLGKVTFSAVRKNGMICINTALARLIVDENTGAFRQAKVAGGFCTTDPHAGNLGGTVRTLDNKKGAVVLEDGVVSASGVAVLDDSASLTLEASGKVLPRKKQGSDCYYFLYGHDYIGAVKDFYRIAGTTPLIPRYALSNWWSRYKAYTQEEYLALMHRFQKEEIPISVATVDMDWHWVDVKKQFGKDAVRFDPRRLNSRYVFEYAFTPGWTGYSWNTELFPDYRAFLKELGDMGLKVTLNLHPAAGVQCFEDMYEEFADFMGIDTSDKQPIAFDLNDEKFMEGYFKFCHHKFEKEGVAFWWIDWQQGKNSGVKGLDPLWALNHYHTLDNGKEHTPLILSRYSGIGAHRYPLGFSGDTMITWKTLAYLPYFTTNASNIGFTWWSHDIGGHYSGAKDDELYVRSVQFGVFSPINRLHCTVTPYMTKEPRFYMNGTGLIAEEFLRLRHKMIPFIYSASVDTTEKGLALMEPMYYDHPESKEAYEYVSQYMFGGQLLVAPVVTPGDEKKMAKTAVWLPEGKWTDIFTGHTYTGGKVVDTVRYMDSIPVLAKEGGFFVLDGRRHTNSVALPDALDVLTFNGNGEYTLHEDNENGRMETRFVSKAESGKQTAEITVSGDECIASRKMKLEFRNIAKGTVRVCENGTPVEASVKTDSCVTVTLPAVKAGAVYTVEVEYDEDTHRFRKRMIDALAHFELTTSQKDHILRSTWKLSEEETLDSIRSCDILSENEKIYMTEEW